MTDTAFWDKIAPRYAKSKISNPDAYEETLTRTMQHLNASDHVLELGCGTGSTALRLAGTVKAYTASDISPAMIDIARAKPGAEALDLRVAGTDRTSYHDLKPDTVLAFNLLHLLPDLDGALHDIHAMLPPGGLFISKTAAIGEKWYFRPLLAAMQFIGKAPFARLMKVPEIDAKIEEAGFELIETGLYPPSTPSRFVVARRI
ncbi:class I SAM-dependent methyltransferase [Rhodobacteraceae bacterium]|nr:class I SAM-dependent methyltransferase [Paracoccaceae bacterium]